MQIFVSMLHGFCLFVWLLEWLKELKDLFTLHKLADKTVMIIRTDDVTSGRRDKSALFDPLLNALLAKTLNGVILIQFLLLLPWLITLLYTTSTCTFCNNCLPNGNSHWVWFAVLLHLWHRNRIWKIFYVTLEFYRFLDWGWAKFSLIGKIIVFHRKYVV